MENKRYFFFDFDGTLAIGTKGIMPESTKKTLAKLEEAGHFVAVATGRLQCDALNHCQNYGIKNLVSDGGYSFTNNGKLISISQLPTAPALPLIEELEKKSISWAVCAENELFCVSKNEKFAKVNGDTYLDVRVDNEFNFEDLSGYYKILIEGDLAVENEIENLKNLDYVRFSKNCIFVEPMRKEIGIKRALDYFGATYDKAVVFGDGKNDLSMFCDEWFSIAMGNAVSELKQRANFITKNVEDDGIEFACKKFGWIK